MRRFRESIRVLHVEDDPDFADLTASFLERLDLGLTIETVLDAEAGLERLEEDEFDCIVSDFDMPGMDGIEFLKAVRGDFPDCPFILFTGKGSEEVASEAISAGVTEYMQKERGTDQYEVLANRIVNAVERHYSRSLVEESEQRLREIIDLLPHLLFVVDEDGVYQLANRALAEFHGKSTSDIQGAHVNDVLDEQAADRFLQDLQEVLETEQEKQIGPVEVTDASGETHNLEPRLRPYRFMIGNKSAVLGYAIKIRD